MALTKTNSIKSIWYNIPNKDVTPVVQKESAPFAVHPLIAIEHFIAERNVNNFEHYPRAELFSDDNFMVREREIYFPINPHLMTISESKIPNYAELKQLVDDTVEYFRTEYTMMQLQSEFTSDWITTVMSAIKAMDRNRLNPDHLRAICKLVPFYQFSKKIMDTSDGLHIDSVKDLETGHYAFKLFRNLEFLYKKYPDNSRSSNTMAYFFLTRTNHLLQVNVEDIALRTAIDTILKLNNNRVSLDISFKKRTIYSSNFSYMISQKIQEVSA